MAGLTIGEASVLASREQIEAWPGLSSRGRSPQQLHKMVIVCSQLSNDSLFNTIVPSVNKKPAHPHWLLVALIGRRPKVTLIRIAVLVTVCFVTFKFILCHEPQRGDIVSVRLAGRSLMFMKRIIGLPGETISFHQGKVFINGQPLAEPYLKFSCAWEAGPFVCGTDEFYVVGDNRSMAFTEHTQGRAERERIVGKLFL